MLFALTRSIHLRLLCLVAGAALAPADASAADAELEQPIEAMRTWRTPDLPSDSVTALIQTRDGFIWIGCSAGLVRFDGATFTPIKLLEGTNGPVWVTALCEDSRGRLWVGTQQSGLFEWEPERVRHFTRQQDLLDDNVTALAADTRGGVWVGGRSGVNLWTGERFQSFTSRDGLPDNFVSGVNVARSGTVWITTRVGMCRFVEGHIAPYAFQTDSQGRSPEYLGAYEDRQGNLWAFGDTYLINLTENKRFNYFRSSEPASVRIWSLCEGRGGRLWIGTSGRGLFCFEDARFQPVVLGGNRWPYDVRALCEDREGTLWLGTSGGGLVQLRPQSVHVFHSGQGLPDTPPTALALDAHGRILVGLPRGGLFAGESGRFERLSGCDGLEAEGFISSVCAAHDGTVWAATLGDGIFGLRDGRAVHFTSANGLADNDVLALCADGEDGVWATGGAGSLARCTSNGVERLDLADGPLTATITALISSGTGGHWLGTSNGRILRERNGKLSPVEMRPDAPARPVLALYEDQDNRLWVGLAGAGLTCLAAGKELNWQTENGLPDNFVSGLVDDGAMNLWLATGAGIYRIRRADTEKTLANPGSPLICRLMCESKTRPDSPTAFGGTRALLAADGKLWFATSEGLLSVDTRPAETEPSAFPVCLETAVFNRQKKISLLGGAAAASQQLPFKAPVDLRSLEVYFTALSFLSPEDLRFRHRLENYDPDWVEDSTVRSAHYNRLPYGRYRFRAAARTSEGSWQEASQTFAFIVPAPIYFQTWAIGLYVVVVLGLVAGTVRVISHRRLRYALARLEQQQTLERERMRIARDMHDEIGSKLTKISFLSEHAQVESASLTTPLAGKIHSIAQTSQELLKNMDEIVWAVNPHNDSLESLAAYLSHYAAEYFQNTPIECQLRLPQEIPHCALSSEARHNLFLAFEEALNNALKHSSATTIHVTMAIAQPYFEVQIADNGKGFELLASPLSPAQSPAGPGGNGLKNMRQRLASIGGECLISSRPGSGTTVTLRLYLPKY
jgi:signal transduction histidine kinase/ligand-binding sensor domain-containing protein